MFKTHAYSIYTVDRALTILGKNSKLCICISVLFTNCCVNSNNTSVNTFYTVSMGDRCSKYLFYIKRRRCILCPLYSEHCLKLSFEIVTKYNYHFKSVMIHLDFYNYYLYIGVANGAAGAAVAASIYRLVIVML